MLILIQDFFSNFTLYILSYNTDAGMYYFIDEKTKELVIAIIYVNNI